MVPLHSKRPRIPQNKEAADIRRKKQKSLASSTAAAIPIALDHEGQLTGKFTAEVMRAYLVSMQSDESTAMYKVRIYASVADRSEELRRILKLLPGQTFTPKTPT